MRGGNFPGLKGAGSGYRNVATTPGAMENKVFVLCPYSMKLIALIKIFS